MPPKKPAYYAVKVGRSPGVYSSWDEASAQVNNFQGAKHKKFPTRAEAEAFANSDPSRPFDSSLIKSDAASGYALVSSSNPPSSSSTSAPDRPAKRAKLGHTGDSVFTKDGKQARTVYCDGSCLGNGKVGSTAGIGVFWDQEVGSSGNKLNLSERLPGPIQTNNRAEMFALARILETDPNPELPLMICTDSQYTISVFSEWIPTWRRKNWRTSNNDPVLNKDLIQYVLALIALRMPPNSFSPTANVSFHKVKAHVGIEGNEQADRLAKNGAMLPAVKEREYEKDMKEVEDRLKKKNLKVDVIDLTFEVDFEEGDLLTDEELRAMETTQYFE